MNTQKKYRIKQKQKGGYNPCEIFDGSIMKKITDNLQKLEIAPRIAPNKDTLEYTKLVNEVFFDCYDILLEYYNDESLYNQEIIRPGDDTYRSDRFTKILHINYTALLMISFLVEFHMFILFYKGIYYEDGRILKKSINFNTKSNLNNNILKNNWESYIFNTETPADYYKNYRDELTYDHTNNTNIVLTFTNFCDELNYAIDTFLQKLIAELHSKLGNLTPVTLTAPITLHELQNLVFYDDYQHCYENWRERIMEFLIRNKNVAVTDIKCYNRIYAKIMESVKNALMIFNESPQFTYTIDGLGMFTWMYSYTSLQKNIDICRDQPTKIILQRLQKKYDGVRRVGCCITSSILEQYSLALIHFKDNSINLSLFNEGIEVAGSYLGRLHIYWIHINNALRTHFSNPKNIKDYKNKEYSGVSHWYTTIINDIKNYNNIAINHPNIDIRNIAGRKYRRYEPLSIKNNKWIYFKALIYLSIDLTSSFIVKNTNNNNNRKISLFESRFIINYLQNIHTYFEQKINFYDNIYKICPLINIKQNSTNSYTYDLNSLINMIIGSNINKFVLPNSTNIKPYLNRNEYNLISNNNNMPKDTSKEIFQNILTLFISNNFYKSKETIYNFFNLINTIFKKAINEYIKEKRLPEKCIQFIFKGSNVLKIIAITNLEKLPFRSRKPLLNIYNKYFKKSDADFQINIRDLTKVSAPNDKNVDQMNEIQEEIENLTYLLLNRIRNFMLENIYKFNDFYKLNSEQQITIFKNIINNINKIHKSKLHPLFNKQTTKFTNLVFNEIHITQNSNILEVPLAQINMKNTYGISQNGRRDFIININQLDPNKNDILTIPKIQKLHAQDVILSMYDVQQNNNVYKYLQNSSYYISINKTIPNFTLARIKVNFKIYYIQKDVEYNTNLSGEYIDVSILKYNQDTEKYFEDDYVSEYKTYFLTNEQIRKEFVFMSLSNNAIIKDLEYILFINNDYPWTDSKYKNRLNRLLLFYTFDLHNKNIANDNKIILLKKIQNIFKRINDLLLPYLSDDLLDENKQICFTKFIPEMNEIFQKTFDELDKTVKITKLLSFLLFEDENSILLKLSTDENKEKHLKNLYYYFDTIQKIINKSIIKSFSLQKKYIGSEVSINYDNSIAPIDIYLKKYIKYKEKYLNSKKNNSNKIYYAKGDENIDDIVDENNNSIEGDDSDESYDSDENDDSEFINDEDIYLNDDFIYKKDIENF